MWDCIITILDSVADACFGEAHWLLAMFYLKLAKNMPRLLANEFDKLKSYKVLLWIGVILNALFPAL